LELARQVADVLPPRQGGRFHKTTPLTYRLACELCSRAFNTVDPKATVGFPFNRRFSTVAEILEHQETYDEIVEIAAQRLLRLSEMDTDDWRYYVDRPLEMLQAGLCDPMLPFNKQEAHPARKVLQQRFRNVWCCGLVDQVLLKALMDGYCHQVTAIYPNCPVTMGLGSSDEKAQQLGELHERITREFGSPPVRSDVSNWDGHFSWVAALFVMEVLKIVFDPPQWWLRAFWGHLVTVVHCVFTLGDGLLYIKKLLGKMPSGTFLTTLGNSIARVAAAFAAGSKHCIAMGDDCNEWTRLSKAELTQAYLGLGLTLRDVELTSVDRFEYCSHEYTRDCHGRWICSLSSWRKAAYTLATKPANMEAILGVLHEMRHNDRYSMVMTIQCMLYSLEVWAYKRAHKLH
jgi:hypothetical protein